MARFEESEDELDGLSEVVLVVQRRAGAVLRQRPKTTENMELEQGYLMRLRLLRIGIVSAIFLLRSPKLNR